MNNEMKDNMEEIKMKIKKILSAVMCLTLAAVSFTACGSSNAQSLDAIKKSGKLIMYTNAAFEPFEYVDSNGVNGVSGVDVDIAKEIAKDLGVELEVQDTEFNSALLAIQQGKGSIAVAGISITPERLESMDFSTPYVKAEQYIVVPKDSNVKLVEDLAGLTVGVQTGTVADGIATDAIEGTTDDKNQHVAGIIEGTGATISRYNTFAQAIQGISSGKIQAVVVDKLPAENFCKNDDSLKCFPVLYKDGSTVQDEYAIAVAKGNTELLNAVNATLKRLQDEGKIEEFMLNHVK